MSVARETGVGDRSAKLREGDAGDGLIVGKHTFQAQFSNNDRSDGGPTVEVPDAAQQQDLRRVERPRGQHDLVPGGHGRAFRCGVA